jgi:hypothetical protein
VNAFGFYSNLTPNEAPHSITFDLSVPWSEAQNQMIWLAHPDNGNEDYFNNRYDARLRQSIYVFTNENTAFQFKLKWR